MIILFFFRDNQATSHRYMALMMESFSRPEKHMSWLQKFSTVGGEKIVLSGQNFGPCDQSQGILTEECGSITGQIEYSEEIDQTPKILAEYGTSGNVVAEYTARKCAVIIAHVKIICEMFPGAGKLHSWRLNIDGQLQPGTDVWLWTARNSCHKWRRF